MSELDIFNNLDADYKQIERNDTVEILPECRFQQGYYGVFKAIAFRNELVTIHRNNLVWKFHPSNLRIVEKAS